jgi:hypothetical protein
MLPFLISAGLPVNITVWTRGSVLEPFHDVLVVYAARVRSRSDVLATTLGSGTSLDHLIEQMGNSTDSSMGDCGDSCKNWPCDYECGADNCWGHGDDGLRF